MTYRDRNVTICEKFGDWKDLGIFGNKNPGLGRSRQIKLQAEMIPPLYGLLVLQKIGSSRFVARRRRLLSASV